MPGHLEKLKGRFSKSSTQPKVSSQTGQTAQRPPLQTLSTATGSSATLKRNSNLNAPQITSAQQVSTPQAPSTLPQQTSTKSDLWDEACTFLTASEQRVVQVIRSSYPTHQTSSNVFEQLRSSAEKKRTECEIKRWKFTFGTQEIILRDVAEKLIAWVDKFKQIGDVIVQYDPVHMALPWAGIRLLLQCTVQENSKMGALLIGMEKIACLTSRCKILEFLYLHDQNLGEALNNLRNALIKLYSRVLHFLAEAHEYFVKGFVSRSLNAIFETNEVKSLLDDLKSLGDQVDKQADVCEKMRHLNEDRRLQDQVKQLTNLLKSIDEPIVRTDQRVSDLWERSNFSETSEILTWISTIPYEDNHKAAREGHTYNTGQWLLALNKYHEWRTISASTVLWLHGIPGAGKTKLITTVIEDFIQALNSHPNDEGFAYFYCNRNEDVRQDPLSILRSIVKQLATSRNGRALQSSLVNIYQNKKRSGFASQHLDQKECEDLLHQYVEVYPQTTIILDALDECNPRTRGKLVNIFDTLIHNSTKPVKIFISSRPDDDIKYRFETGPNVSILATDNENDIASFVKEKLLEFDKGRRNKLSNDLHTYIVDALLNKSQGMFQWAALQIAQLLELRTEDDMRLRLGRLPPDLKAAYDEIYAGIERQPENAKTVAFRALCWVMQASKPLSPQQLVAAVCQDPTSPGANPVNIDINTLLDTCRNLLVVDHQLDVCRFSHLSVQEYLENHQIQPINADYLIARACLQILVDDDLQGLSSYQQHKDVEYFVFREGHHPPRQYRSDRDLWYRYHNAATSSLNRYEDERLNGLMRYIVHDWQKHVQKCEELVVKEHLTSLLMQFFGSPDGYSVKDMQWLNILYFSDRSTMYIEELVAYPKGITAMCCLGSQSVLAPWWTEIFADFEKWRSHDTFLVNCAILSKDVCLYQRLIKNCADINHVVMQPFVPLVQAAELGSIKAVELLVDQGADVNQGGGADASALQVASRYGHIDIVRLLLDRGADVNQGGGDYGSALQAASRYGYIDIVRLLLDQGADVNQGGGYYGSALQAASVDGHIDVVRLLISHRAKGEPEVARGYSPDELNSEQEEEESSNVSEDSLKD